MKWRAENHDAPLCKVGTTHSPYANLRVPINKKSKGKGSVFCIRLKQQGPVRLIKSPQVMSIFVGEMGRAIDAETLRVLLGNPRDLLSEKQDSGDLRGAFIYSYDTTPLDPKCAIFPLKCEECSILGDSFDRPSPEGFPLFSISATFKVGE